MRWCVRRGGRCLTAVRRYPWSCARLPSRRAEAVSRITVEAEKRQLISVLKMGYSGASRPFRIFLLGGVGKKKKR